jgi:hypothetical protein
LADLVRIGQRLTALFFERVLPNHASELELAMKSVEQMAADVAAVDGSSSARREMAKRTCAWLLVKHGVLERTPPANLAVDAEV